jgi:EmrB/QacA subfamily drug resistance transporter
LKFLLRLRQVVQELQIGGTRPLTHAETRLICLGVLLPVFMGSVDQTILASALPTIGRDFGDVHSLPWLITAFLIASTAVTPLYGKFSDIHGRRFTLLIAIGIFMTGALISALAPSMLALICGRVIQGFGAGGLTSMGMVVLGDVAAPKDRGRYYAYFAIAYTSAGACGPALGGFFADYLHWSVIFWFQIPLGLIAIVLILTLLKRLPRHDRPHKLDFLGAVLIMVASSAFMLMLNLGGVRFAWTSPFILALGAFALAVGAGFVLRLARAPEPLIPLSILGDPLARLAIVGNASGWAAIIGLNIFLPIYLQSVMGLSATSAGLSLVILMVALNVSAGLAGQLLGRVTHYKMLPMIAVTIAMISVVTLALNADRMTPWMFQALLALIGIGFGPTPSLMSVSLQNTVSVHQLGIAIGTMNFTRNLLGTIVVAVFGAIVLAGVPVGETTSLTGALRSALGDSAEAFSRAFYLAAACFAVTMVCMALLEEKPLKTGQP